MGYRVLGGGRRWFILAFYWADLRLCSYGQRFDPLAKFGFLFHGGVTTVVVGLRVHPELGFPFEVGAEGLGVSTGQLGHSLPLPDKKRDGALRSLACACGIGEFALHVD
jgi:hypothetical protein